MTQIIDGKKISQEIKDELREQVAEQKKLGKEAALAVIQAALSLPTRCCLHWSRRKAISSHYIRMI